MQRQTAYRFALVLFATLVVLNSARLPASPASSVLGKRGTGTGTAHFSRSPLR